MVDVLCLGEALIDLVPDARGVGLAETDLLVKAAGGAPANVAAGVAKLGATSAFMGMVGDDGFGRFLAATLEAAGVDVTGLRVTTAAPTALAAVSLAADGERDFIFYGHPAAHTLFAPGDVDESLIQGTRILHMGSIGLIGGPIREATLHAVDCARKSDVLVSYDPNLRLPLWPDAEAAHAGLRLGLSLAEIVKISEDEVRFLAGDACDLEEAARSLWHPRLRLMVVTRGRKGALWIDPVASGTQPGIATDAVDTTGAGDAFTAALLTELLATNFGRDRHSYDRALRVANAAGALATMKRGAIPALPDRAAVDRLLADCGSRT